MATKIQLPDNGVVYTLEYNRRTVQLINKQGFKPSELEDNVITMIPLLFWGAFRMHHPRVDMKASEDIYSRVTNKEGLINALVTMYSEPIKSLLDEPEETKGDDEGNISWTMV